MVTGFNDNNEEQEREKFVGDVVVMIYLNEDNYDYGLPLIYDAEIRLKEDQISFIGKNAPIIEAQLSTAYHSNVDIDSKIQGVDTTNYLAEIRSGLKVKEVTFI